jgi:rubrerythrin
MKIDEQTIQTLIEEDEAFCYVSTQFVMRLTEKINKVLHTMEQAAYLKAEMDKVGEKYEEDTGELDAEMARLVEECLHPSQHELPREGGPDFPIFVCNICGSIVEDEDDV